MNRKCAICEAVLPKNSPLLEAADVCQTCWDNDISHQWVEAITAGEPDEIDSRPIRVTFFGTCIVVAFFLFVLSVSALCAYSDSLWMWLFST